MKIKMHYPKKMLAWLLPFTCVICHNTTTREQDLCQACLMDLPILTSACQKCAKPFATLQQDLTCGYCLKYPPPFDRTFAPFLYESLITQLIMNLKFGHALANARILGELITQKIQTQWYQERPLPEAIIPIPLHANRLKERGFNQALEIARPIAKALKRPLMIDTCQRIKGTAAQATLKSTERRENMKNAFQIHSSFHYRHVAVLDDVMTTGYTMMEFCSVLKDKGIERIDVWCCARPVF